MSANHTKTICGLRNISFCKSPGRMIFSTALLIYFQISYSPHHFVFEHPLPVWLQSDLYQNLPFLTITYPLINLVSNTHVEWFLLSIPRLTCQRDAVWYIMSASTLHFRNFLPPIYHTVLPLKFQRDPLQWQITWGWNKGPAVQWGIISPARWRHARWNSLRLVRCLNLSINFHYMVLT